MKRFPKLIIVSITTFAIGVCSVAGWIYYQESQRIEVILPAHRWEPIFFKDIDRITDIVGIKQLRTTVIGKDDVEVRFWHGFGLQNTEAVILKRSAGHWSAKHIVGEQGMNPEWATIEDLPEPRLGFDKLWNELTGKGLLTLADASEIDCEYEGLDGLVFVVELNQNHTYRTYMYGGDRCYQARTVDTMDAIIGEQFSTENDKCTTDEWFGCGALRLSRIRKDPIK
jgi:hypothetical protein